MDREKFLDCCRLSCCQDQARQFFAHCPQTVMDYLQLKKYRKGQRLIQSGDACNSVYILIQGGLQTMEERAGDSPYRISRVLPLDIAGDYELFADARSHYATVLAEKDSQCLVLPSRLYMDWMQKDVKALFQRTRLLMQQLYSQSQFDRQYLSMDYRTRCLFTLYYECAQSPQGQERYILSLNREELAAKTGCSLRTVQRLIQDLKEQDIIQTIHGKISLSASQKKALGEYVTDFLRVLE